MSTSEYVMIYKWYCNILNNKYTVYCTYCICVTNFLFRIDKRKYSTLFITYMETYTFISKSNGTGRLISIGGRWTNILPAFLVTCVSILLRIFKYQNSARKCCIIHTVETKNCHNQYYSSVGYSVGWSFANRRIKRITAG